MGQRTLSVINDSASLSGLKMGNLNQDIIVSYISVVILYLDNYSQCAFVHILNYILIATEHIY